MKPINSRRSRVGRNGGKRAFSNGSNRSFESNGTDVKVRGTPHQICERYQTLAHDAAISGDRIAAEGYFQHAEHYFRLINGTDGQPRTQVPQPIPETQLAQFDSAVSGGLEAPIETETPDPNFEGSDPTLS
jgi:hypothetical protein